MWQHTMIVKTVCALCVLAHLASGVTIDLTRLREQELTWQFSQAENVLGDVPIVDPPTRTAGYFKLDNATKQAEMFFFHFQARQNPTAAPVVLWMTGGPGCSSELAVLYENGPYTFDKAKESLNLVETQYGWDATHNMIFVDQPIGTGFSFSEDDSDTVYNEKGVADDMLDFLHHFLAAHPEYEGLPLYVTGESYAGHYVPAVSHRVWLSNKNQEGPHINFKGLAVGNGLTEPSIQFNAYGDFAVQAGLISQATRGWMSFLFPVCHLANKWCDSTNWDWLCSLGQTYCMVTQFEPILDANPNVNVYDYSRKCEGRLCYDFTKADRFLNLPSTREALGVAPGTEWQSCNYDVYANFAGDWLHRYDSVLPDMMEDGIRVMIYAGDLDIICNYLGNRRWVDALDWYGSDYWDDETDEEWQVAGQPAGKVKHWGPLSFVQIYKAGHMVPMDQPLNALAMITAWTRNHKVMDVMGIHRLGAQPAMVEAAAGNSGEPQPEAHDEYSLPALFARLQDGSNLKGQAAGKGQGRDKRTSRAQVRVSSVGARLAAATLRVRAAAQATARNVANVARKMLART